MIDRFISKKMNCKYVNFLNQHKKFYIYFILIFHYVLSVKVHAQEQYQLRNNITKEFANGLKNFKNQKSGLVPSHTSHPGFEHLTFLYDQTINALIFKAAGDQAEAEHVIDYFVQRLQIPCEQVLENVDSNKIYGIVKLFQSKNIKNPLVAPINAIDISNISLSGKGQLEYWTTPGPIAFLIMAMLQVNPSKYRQDAISLGQLLLSMQNEEGGILDGDRGPENVHTEPHMDSLSAFLQLYKVTGQSRWKKAADRAFAWFKDKVYVSETGTIHQGYWSTGLSTIFATDAYSWTLSGAAGDYFSNSELKKLTHTMLSKCLTQVQLEFPDHQTKNLILVDFTDALDPQALRARHGFHPMGSMEWVGGVILALQKNAVRFWKSKKQEDRAWAQLCKSLAELLTEESLKGFYSLEHQPGVYTFYATAQGVSVGHGWDTPYFYTKSNVLNPGIEGSSSVGGWPIFPIQGFNPFILGDHYFATYQQIPQGEKSQKIARNYVEQIVAKRTYCETVPLSAPDPRIAIVELENFNHQMWDAVNKKDWNQTIFWATKITENTVWTEIAVKDQRLKQQELGGLVNYPWGIAPEQAENDFKMIWKYPILNEMGAAFWGLTQAYFKTGNLDKAKNCIREVVQNYSLHQIYDPDQKGHWNALSSWENESTILSEIYQEVQQELKQHSIVLSAKKSAKSTMPFVLFPSEN